MAMEMLFWTLAAVFAVASGQVEHSVCEVSEINLTTITTALLYSPSPGDNVSSTRKCTVRVTNSEHSDRIIQLDVTSFSLGGREPCSFNQEYLQISFPYSGRGDVDTIRWCGQSYTPRLETRQVMDITYFPGPQAERGPGFNITITTDLSFHCGGRELMVGDQPMFLYSPGYPAPYDRNMIDCKWTVQSKDSSSLLVDTQRFSLEDSFGCNHDYVQIDSAKHCGDRRIRFISKTNQLELQFVTNNLTEEDGFIFKFIESPSSSVESCGTEVVADNAPRLLQLPIIEYGETMNMDCWWLVDSGSDDSVVLLEMNKYDTTALCKDFNISIYDGMNMTLENRILWICSSPVMINTIRSSSRYLYIQANLTSTGQSRVNVSFTYSSSRRDTFPRLFYADFGISYVWVDLDAGLDLGLLIQGAEGSVSNYRTCVKLSIYPFHNITDINASEVIYAFSGWDESFAELTTACGRKESRRIVSRGSKLFIKLRENRPPSLRYVWLQYTLWRNCKPEIVHLQSEYMTPQTLQSDFSLQKVSGTFRPTNHYPNNVYCRWLIAPQNSEYFVQIHVQNSSLYNIQDSVKAYDRSHLLTWTGSQTPTILSRRGDSLGLDFITNEKFTDTGFTLDYSSVKNLSDCPSMATLIAGDEDQLLSSPNFPSRYTSDMDCKWRITSTTGVVELTLLSLPNDQSDDSCLHNNVLIIMDQSEDNSGHALADFCGSNQTQRTYVSYSHTLLVHFHANQSASSTGFQLQYKSSTNPDFWNCNREILVTEDEDQEITSPLYPNSYPGYVNCYWHVKVQAKRIVMLEVVDADVSCSPPVFLYDGASNDSHVLARVCTHWNQKQYLSSEQSMYITFRSTSNYDGWKGFTFRLRSMEDNNACYGKTDSLMAYWDKRYITSPGYPGHYPPNSDCKWRILSGVGNSVVHVKIEDAEIESSDDCSSDSVTVYDGSGRGSPQLGKVCGEKQASYSSQGNIIFISFTSDARIQYRGFRMAYWAVRAPPRSTSPSGGSGDDAATAKIIGGVMAGVVLIIALIAICYCTSRRKRQARSQHQPSQQRPQSEQGSTVHVLSPTIVNGSFMTDDLPPAYNTVNASLLQPSPPMSRELDDIPPYTDTMKESYPPSNPSSSPRGREGGTGDSTIRDHQSLSPEVSGSAHHQHQSSDHDYDTLSDATVMNNIHGEQQSSAQSTHI